MAFFSSVNIQEVIGPNIAWTNAGDLPWDPARSDRLLRDLLLVRGRFRL